jgi:hypothetical protein
MSNISRWGGEGSRAVSSPYHFYYLAQGEGQGGGLHVFPPLDAKSTVDFAETALHTAAESNHHEAARLLLQHDPMLVNMLRKTKSVL